MSAPSNGTEAGNDQDARTIHVGNLSNQVTEALFYELFLQAGPLERISIPKDKDGTQRPFGFVTYKHLESVRYAMAIFHGTQLFQRDLRLNNRSGNNGNNNNNRNPMNFTLSHQQQPIQQTPIQQQQHQQTLQEIQMRISRIQNESNAVQPSRQQEPNNRSNDVSALRGPQSQSFSQQSMSPASNPFTKKGDVGGNALDFDALLSGANNMLHSSHDNNSSPHQHQSKMTHRLENRPHHHNSNYPRMHDRDRRGGNDRGHDDRGRRGDSSRDRDRGSNGDYNRRSRFDRR